MRTDPIDHTSPAATIAPPNPIDQYPPLGHIENGESTLSKAPPVDSTYAPSKPQLDPPLPDPLIRTLDLLANRIEPLHQQWMDFNEQQISKQFDIVDNCYLEQAKQVDANAAASKNANFWGVLEDIASTISSATGLVTGASAALAGSPAIGGALIASGVLSIGNLAFKHGGIWDSVASHIAGDNCEQRAAISSYLPTAIGLSATALSFAGAYGAWQYVGQTGLQMTSRLLQSTVTISDSLIHYKSSMAQSEQSFTLAKLSALQSKGELSKMDLQELISDVQQYHEHQVDLHATLGKVLEERNRTIQLVLQPV